MRAQLWAALLGLSLLLLAGVPTSAQTLTAVTGTVTDPAGLPYAGATLQAILISPGGPSPSLTPCTNNVSGCPIQQEVPPTTLGPDGSFSLTLWANASILPASTSYSFTVTLSPGAPLPVGTGPQSFTVTGVTIAGASQSLSGTLSNSAPSLTSSLMRGATQASLATTNFGVALGTQTVVPSGTIHVTRAYTISFYQNQSVTGVSCGAGSNTVTPTLAWIGPKGNAQTLALTPLSISANGAADSFQAQTVSIAAQANTAITYTTASVLASAGCTLIPQYQVFVYGGP